MLLGLDEVRYEDGALVLRSGSVTVEARAAVSRGGDDAWVQTWITRDGSPAEAR